MFDFSVDSGEPRQRFAFAEASVNEDAGAFGFEQRQIARTAGRKNGNVQPDRVSPNNCPNTLYRRSFRLYCRSGFTRQTLTLRRASSSSATKPLLHSKTVPMMAERTHHVNDFTASYVDFFTP